MISKTNSIGIFDSGIGGLSVLRAVREQMPNESIIYFGDQRKCAVWRLAQGVPVVKNIKQNVTESASRHSQRFHLLQE